MKTYALYGFISSLAGAFIVLILYFTGLHSDIAKLPTAQWVGGLLGLAAVVTCLILGIKARREEVPLDEDFGFGKSFFAAFMISTISTLLNTVFNYIYNVYINPGFTDIMLQDRLNKIEASGASGAKMDQAEAMTRTMFHPVPQAIFYVIFGMVLAVVLSLIMAGFFTRKAVQPPKITA
ncbi:MAG TPA: DUF4199 domain-containing protein [Opitutaceae bacterium]|jgi:hypothetical protein|nr:DUF4199 domain-containing protein [Opitutaceae bacterium]